MNKNLKLIIASICTLASAVSCVEGGFGRDSWDTPNIACNNKFEAPTMSLAEFVALSPSSGTRTITEDIIIDGYVISSDEHGNFYKSIVFQDSPNNPTVGLQIEVNKSSNYADFPIGSHIRINAKGLILGTDRGVVKLGATDPNFAIGRIPESQFNRHISIVCANGKADIATITPLELNSLSQAKSTQYINTLVSVPNVQFSDEDILGVNGVKTFINLSPKEDTDRTLVDANNATAVLRNSQFVDFGAEKLPHGKGKISFVVSRYNTNYQMLIRDIKDIAFTEDRSDIAPAKGGSAITHLTAGNIENFESYTATGVASETFTKYYNDPIVGNRYWRVANFGGNKYIQMGYPATGAKPYTRTYFAIPVDFDNANQLSFKTKDGHYNGVVLKVYYSTDYTPNNINATLVDISSHFSIAQGTTTGFAPAFTESGVWNKPSSLTGKGYIIFEYQGGGSLPTSTMQIDDITIQ